MRVELVLSVLLGRMALCVLSDNSGCSVIVVCSCRGLFKYV